MTNRRKVIRNVLSTLQDSEEEGVTLTDCGTGSQIKVFSGASININVTNIDKSRTQNFKFGQDCTFDNEERQNFYRKCHGIAKQYDVYPEMRRHMGAQWGAKSMRELSVSALKDLLVFMRGLERSIQNAETL